MSHCGLVLDDAFCPFFLSLHTYTVFSLEALVRSSDSDKVCAGEAKHHLVRRVGVETMRAWVPCISLLTWLYFQSKVLAFLMKLSPTRAGSCVLMLYKDQSWLSPQHVAIIVLAPRAPSGAPSFLDGDSPTRSAAVQVESAD